MTLPRPSRSTLQQSSSILAKLLPRPLDPRFRARQRDARAVADRLLAQRLNVGRASLPPGMARVVAPPSALGKASVQRRHRAGDEKRRHQAQEQVRGEVGREVSHAPFKQPYDEVHGNRFSSMHEGLDYLAVSPSSGENKKL